MKKIILSSVWLLFGAIAVSGQATDLFISEYVEGSSNNKYIEIYNGTGASVNLNDYRLRLFANGASPATNDVQLSGVLANGAVIVYQNSSASIYAGTNNTAVSFNGDDAIGLWKISTNSYVDIFGKIGCDPGTSWGGLTVDKTLRRKSNVCSGVTVNPSVTCNSSSFPTLTSEWDDFPIDNISDLGTHTATCTVVAPCSVATQLTYSSSAFAPVENSILPSFTVSVACSSGILSNCNNGFITLTTTGCALSGTLTQPVINGVATFNDILFSRSAQNNVQFIASYTGTCASSTLQATSAVFQVSNPPFVPTIVDIKNMDFSSNPIPWNYNIGTPIIVGSGGSGNDLFGVVTQGGNSYLRKSYSVNNGGNERGTQNTATFDNVLLNTAYAHEFSIKIASLNNSGTISVNDGNGVDIGEDLLIETSIDGGATWHLALTNLGSSNKLFTFANTATPVNISYNAGIIYSTSDKTSNFKISIPAGSSNFMFRFTATNNRTQENWCIDDVRLIQIIPPVNTFTPLPDLNLATPVIVCPGSAFVPSFTLTNTVGTSSYSWFANTDISNTSIANPSIIPSAGNQTYTLLVTDADNCKDSSTVTVHFPSGNLGEWIGTVSTDWFNCLNWGSGRVPDSTVDVLIDGTMALRDCEISNLSTLSPIPSEAFANSISLDNVAELSVHSSMSSATKLRVASDVLIDNNAQFLAHGSSLISVGGDWFDLTGNLNSSDNGIYIFNGSTQQEISGISPLFFNRIKFYNPVNVKLNPEVISLDVEYAGYTTDGMLTVGNASNAGVLTHSLGGHNGIIRSHTFGVSPILNRLFPIVNPAKELRFAEIDIVPTATYSYLDIGYIETPMGNLGLTIPSANTGGFAFDISDSENDGYWNVEKDALLSPINTSNYSIKLSAENYSNISSMANVSMVKRDNTLSNWQAPGTHIAGTLMGNMASISRSGLVGFSDFGFGYNVTPLPVSLGSFDINCEDGYASVKWTTLQESNSDYFEIQASQNGTDYLSLAHIPAAGNSNTLLPYSYVYLNRENYAYWRLKQVDFNADYELFAPKYATCSEENIEFSVLQQNGNLVLVGPENKQVLWSIYSLDGKLVFAQKANGTFVHTTWAQYATGIYVLKAQSNLEEEVFKIFKP